MNRGELQPQEPPQVTYTIGFAFIPPPSPPRLAMEAHQEPSAKVGEDTSITIQIVSTPPTIETQEK